MRPAPRAQRQCHRLVHGTGTSLPASCPTDATGQCSVQITSTSVGSSVIQASDGTYMSNTVPLNETAGPPANVGLSLSQTTIVDDGSSSSTATVIVTDASSNLLSGQSIRFDQSGTPVSISLAACHNGLNGQCPQVTITGTSVGTTHVTAIATSDGASSTTQTLTETAGPAQSGLLLSPSTILADGTSGNGHRDGTRTFTPLSGQSVRFTQSGTPVSISPSTCTTGSNGTCRSRSRAPASDPRRSHVTQRRRFV